jgi:hypothetical protein
VSSGFAGTQEETPTTSNRLPRLAATSYGLPCGDGAGEVAVDTAVALPAGETPAPESGLERNPSALDVRCFLDLTPLIAGMKTRCHYSLLWEAGVLDDG